MNNDTAPARSDPAQLEARAQWIYRNLLEDLQLGCLCRNKKQGNVIVRAIDHEDDGYWIDLVRKHVGGATIEAELVTKDGVRFAGTGVCLGIYFGGTKCKLGPNLTRSIALDCDKPNSAELLPLAQQAFPFMQFFQKMETGRWHAHGRVSRAVDARAVKAWMISRLPSQISDIEVFPKTSDFGEAVFGNFIRLPMNPGYANYEPVGELKDLVPVDADIIPLWKGPLPRASHTTVRTQKIPSFEHDPLEVERIPSHPLSTEEAGIQEIAVLDDHKAMKTPEDERLDGKLQMLLSNPSTRYLQKYIDGYQHDGRRNSNSEFDWRFLLQLKKLGHENRVFLDYCLRIRNPSRASNSEKDVHYRELTIDKLLRQKSVKETVFNKPVCPIRPADMTQSWLYKSEIWNHRMAGRPCRDVFLAHYALACEKTDWACTGWSPTYFISVRTMVSNNCGALSTVRKSEQMLRLLGLVKLIRQGRGTQASRFQLLIPTSETEISILEAVKFIKEQRLNLLKKAAFSRLLTEVRREFSILHPDEWTANETDSSNNIEDQDYEGVA